MHNESRHENDSRRVTQRRFPPGDFWVSPRGDRACLIIGWAPIPAVERLRRPWDPFSAEKVTDVATWEALILADGPRLEHLRWESIRSGWTLDEWEEG